MSEATPRSRTSRLDLANRLPDVRWGLLPILLVPVVVSFWPESPVLLTEQEDNAATAAVTADIPDYYLLDAKISALNDQGNLHYQIRTGELRHYPDDSVTANRLEVDYFGPEGRWQLSAPRGNARHNGEELQLSGGVVARGRRSSRQPQTTMRMDSARVWLDAKRLATDDPVRIDDPTRRVRAIGMIMDIDQDVVKLKKNVRVNHEP